jgi:hypothetical protein
MDDGPQGLAIDAAQRIVLNHVNGPCGQCKGRRCWMLETAVKVVMFDGEEIDPAMRAALTDAARKIADVHKPADDGLCSPCLLPIPECEPYEIATAWLQVIGEPLQPAGPGPDLTEARQVVQQHQGYGCPECTPQGCPAEDRAVPLVFDDVVSRWPDGPKTLDDLEKIAREIRGDET